MSLGADQYQRVLLVLILAHTAWDIPGGASGKKPTWEYHLYLIDYISSWRIFLDD